jgi:ribonuclease BN (tRNA processing enzyme)
MRLTVVGCSGSAPGPDSACSSYLVEDQGFRLLLDLGAGASGPLQRYAAAPDIDAVILSHAHSDHWSDLTQLGYLRERNGCGPLPVTGPSDLPEVVWSHPDVFAAVVAEPGVFKAGPISGRLSLVEHGECWATRIGDALCYTADTAPGTAIDELAAGCGVLLAEASGLDSDGALPGHLTAGDAGRIAARSGTRLLILTHLRAWQDHTQLLEEASRIAGCPVILAHPGLRVALGGTASARSSARS